MRFKILDLETENHYSFLRTANPFDKRNYIVAAGWFNQGDAQASYTYYANPEEYTANPVVIEDDIGLLIGHNIKFDLLYLYDNASLKAFLKRGGRIWDTQYAEYLLNAQIEKFQRNALNDVSLLYGGTEKIDAVKELWEAGHLTSTIHKDLLIDYLVGTEEENRLGGDIGNTLKVFLGQVTSASSKGMLPSISRRMEGLLATTEMEYNGLLVDTELAKVQQAELEARLESTSVDLNSFIPELPDGATFNWKSSLQKSCLIFGGTVSYSVKRPLMADDGVTQLSTQVKEKVYTYKDIPIVDTDRLHYNNKDIKHIPLKVVLDKGIDIEKICDRYQSGKRVNTPKLKTVIYNGDLKYRNTDVLVEFPGYTEPESKWKTKSIDAIGRPTYKTGADIIDEISNRNVPFCNTLKEYTAISKDLTTYYLRYDERTKKYVGMLAAVGDDGIVHHSLNHTTTITSRLSSNNPNMQNIPRGDKSNVKALFSSRFGSDGMMLEADYSQLEVVVQGVLSKDVNLCSDLRNRIDFHCKRVAAKYHIEYDEAVRLCKHNDGPDADKWKAARNACKGFSFQRAYGAGPATIAESTGLTVDEVKELVAAEEKMYPNVKLFYDTVEHTCKESATYFADPQADYKKFQRGYWMSPTHTLYTWRTSEANDKMKKRGIMDTWSRPALQNYPIQGTGGEIVQARIGAVFRHFINNNNYGGKALLVNTVHDCIWVDCHKDVVAQVAKDVKEILEDVPASFPELEITVPFPVEVEAGVNMNSLKEI